MDLMIRLNILKDAKLISENGYEGIVKTIAYFKEEKGLVLTEENGAMFITHLCSALTRIENGELVNKIEDFIFEEIQKDSKYDETVEIVNHLENVLGKLPKDERDFIEMHICTLLNM